MSHPIVCGVDLSSGGEGVAGRTMALAAALDRRAVLVHVTRRPARQSGLPSLGRVRELRRLGALVEHLGAAGRAETELRAGDPADELLGIARELDAELLVVGSRGLRELGSVLLGSVSSALMRDAPCPVVVVPPGCAAPLAGIRSIVVGVDGGPRDSQLLRLAADLARRVHAPLHVVHAYDAYPVALGAAPAPPPPLPRLREAAEATVDQAVAQAQVAARTSVAELPAAQALEGAAEQDGAGLIALASQGRGKLHSILHGSVTVRLAAEAPVPVLVLPPGAELASGSGHYELTDAA